MIKSPLIHLCLLFGIVVNTNAQDVLVDKENNEYKVVYNRREGKKIYYADYDDPDFKQVVGNRKDFKKVVLANQKTIWFTMRDNYFRFRTGLIIGSSIPIGNFASTSPSNDQAGYADAAFYGAFTLEKQIYKFIDLKLQGHYTSSPKSNINSLKWSAFGFGIGPQLKFKLGSRFYLSIPFLYNRSSFTTSIEGYDVSSIYYKLDGEGIGNGFVSGLGINVRIGQSFSLGYNLNYNYQKVKMRYTYEDVLFTTLNYEKTYSWAYLMGAYSFVIHF